MSAGESLLAYDDAVMVRACLQAVTRCSLADRVPLDGVASLAQLGPDVGWSAADLVRVLRALAHRGIFALEEREGNVTHTELSRLLCTHVEGSLAAHFRSVGPTTFAPAFWRALDSRTSAVESATGSDFWTYLSLHAEELWWFQLKMAEQLCYLDLSRLQKQMAHLSRGLIVDVAGGNGELLRHIAPHPDGSAVVLELPAVELAVKRHGLDSAAVEFVAGDMFESLPAGGGAYILCRTLHDWDDSTCRLLLENIKEAAGEGGELIVIERVLNAPGAEVRSGPERDIAMRLLFSGGRERRVEEWHELLRSAGWRVINEEHLGDRHVSYRASVGEV